MEAIIQATISALGFLENDVYYQEPDCYETIRDLIRFLRTDNSEMLARRICGERNIIGNDLIPIIKSENVKGKMFDITLRLLVNLTQPALVSLMGKHPESSEEWQKYWLLVENLKKAKPSFADTKFFTVLKLRLEMYFLETAWEDRVEEDRLVMERIIVLIRYIFGITNTGGHEEVAMECGSHDRVLSAFFDSGIQKVLIHIASQSVERDFHLSILSIFALIIAEHNPSDIVVAGRQRTTAEKENAEEELRQVFMTEQARMAAQRRRILSNRHPRFYGSYVVKGLPAVNKKNDLPVYRPIKSLAEITYLDDRKKQKIVPKNRRPFEGKLKAHLCSVDLQTRLRTFVEEILSTCFNCLIKTTQNLAFDSRLSFGQRDSNLHFFLLMRFLLEYNRLSGRASSEVSVCLSVETFYQVRAHIYDSLESAQLMKKEAKHFGRRAQYSLSAYKELVLFLQHLIKNGSSEEKDIAQRLSYHVLIEAEYREMGLTMIRKFSPAFLSKTYLSELILFIHHYLRLLENAVKSGQLNTVKKRSKIRRRRTRRKENFDQTPLPALVDQLSSEDLNNKWPTIIDELRDIILGNLDHSSDQIPINSLLDVQEEQHQKFAMLKVQRALREGRTKDAMGLYRASRELWPADGIFGDPESSTEDQLDEIRAIFFTDLKNVADELLNVELAMQKKFSSESFHEGEDEESSSSDEEINEQERFETKEVNFDFLEYVVGYARTDVLRWYVFLLSDFATNSVELNKALLKLLHRIAFDLDMPSRLFQLSLFRIFAKVRTYFEMPRDKMRKNPLFELYNFGHHLLKKFFSYYRILEDKLAPEILFWKGPKESYEIQNGYGSYDASKNAKKVNAWSWDEELENELRSLYNEYRDMDERPEGMDVLDFIEPNLSHPRTRKQIYKKLREFALDPLGAKANKSSAMDRNFPIIQMKKLIEEFNSLQGKEESPEDMVEFLRTRLIGNEGEQFSRKRILKQMSHQGIVYEKKKKLAPSKSKWSEELQTELKLLKQQYDEMDEDDHELISLVDYVMRRLSEKKPRRQVEQQLRALGATIVPRIKTKSTKGTQNAGTGEGNENLSYEGNSKGEGCYTGGHNSESSSISNENKDHLIDSPVKLIDKRKRLLSSSDEDDHFELGSSKKGSMLYNSSIPSTDINMESSSTDVIGNDEISSPARKVDDKRKRLLSASVLQDDSFELETKEKSLPYDYCLSLEGTGVESSSVDDLGIGEFISAAEKVADKYKRPLSASEDNDCFELGRTKERSSAYKSTITLDDTNVEFTSTHSLDHDELTDLPIKTIYHRKRLLSTSDDDENLEMKSMREVSPPSTSPVPFKKKKHRVIVSDSEED